MGLLLPGSMGESWVRGEHLFRSTGGAGPAAAGRIRLAEIAGVLHGSWRSMWDHGRKVVLAGVSGSGKSVVGRELARLIGAGFVDADDYHSPAAIARMAAGTALTDGDRLEWLRTLGEVLARSEGSVVLACSALKRDYRDRLREQCGGLEFVLLKSEVGAIRERIAIRHRNEGHFMPPSLLDSQLATLEEGDDMRVVENTGDVGEVAGRVKALLGA